MAVFQKFSASQTFSHKAVLWVGGSKGCRVIKVKPGNALAEESAEWPSCGSDGL